jgi:hypothetical protein
MTEKKLDEILFIVKGFEAKLLSMLKPESQETVKKELELPDITETIEAEVGVITEKAVGVLNHDGSKICWIPKKAIANLDKIVIDQGKSANLLIADWFQSKIKWVKNEPRG